MEMRTGGTPAGADKSYNCSCLNNSSLLGIYLTEMTIETAEVAVVKDYIVAVAGVTIVHSGHSARKHAID